MIDLILKLLRSGDHLGYSQTIDIAKGKYKLPLTIKEKSKQKAIENAWKEK